MQAGSIAVVAGHAGVWRVVATTGSTATATVFSYVDGALMAVAMTALQPVPDMTRTDDQPTPFASGEDR